MALAALSPGTAQGQDLPVGDPVEDYLRLLQISGQVAPGSFTVRPLALAGARDGTSRAAHPWAGRLRLEPTGTSGELSWRLADARLRTFVNSRHPRGQNDGAVWQGKGLTTSLDAGGWLRWRGLTVTLNPMLLYNQNAGFELAPVLPAAQPRYAYPWWTLDYPQRFGSDAFWTFDPGQSRIALDWKAARVSFGTESLWWGPGIRNAIVMSNNAPGFPHAALSTNRPIDIGIGALEGRWIWGRLAQSDYFDPTITPDRFTTGIVLAWSPSFLEGLTLGGTRMFQLHVPEGGVDAGEYLLALQGLVKNSQVSEDSPDGTDDRDQLLSLFGRWVLPESGFEVYFEWARNDHAGSLYDFALEPEHSQAYTLGFQKVIDGRDTRFWVFRGELTHLQAPATFELRPRGVYYTHGLVRQGYTHRGQILGAGIGPGSNAQLLGVDRYETWGRAGLFAARQVHDNDAFYAWAEVNDATYDQHDVSLDFGADALLFAGDFDLGGSLTVTRELNRYFFGPHVTNVNVGLSARWRPGGR